MQQLRNKISGHRGRMNRHKPKDIGYKFEDEDAAALAEHLRTVRVSLIWRFIIIEIRVI